MLKHLIRLLILLSLVTGLNAGTESKTLWDLIERKSESYGLQVESVFIDEDPWTMKINEDYEKLIDVMITTLESTELPKDPVWYEKPEMLVLLGFVGGFLTAK